MMKNKLSIFSLLLLLVISGCATMPSGPSVMVLPPPDKSFEQFQAEDAVCRQWASQQIGASPQEGANQNTAQGAIIGTALGAGLGAAIGSASGNAGTGAAIGAASGLLIGTSAGAESGQVYGLRAQRRYDIAYMQCMYAKGNSVPGTARRVRSVRRVAPPPPDLSKTPPDAPPDQSGPPEDYVEPRY
jgi:hypothetical protein